MSFQALVTNLALRYSFRPKPGALVNPKAARANLAKLVRRNPPPPADIQWTSVAGTAQLCPARWFQTQESNTVVMYFHGGGYFFGNIDSHAPVCGYLARAAKARVLSVDYRLAPEHPCPAAVEDALAWYREVLSHTPAARIVLAGDSAGGGLALACAMAIAQAGLAQAAGLVLFSPWTDLSCSGESYHSNATQDVMFTPDSLPQAAAIYLQGMDPKSPIASPLFGDIACLPPMLIFASTHEILLSDSVNLHEKAIALGKQSTLKLAKRLPHVWPTMLHLPEARNSLRDSAAFIAQVTQRGV